MQRRNGPAVLLLRAFLGVTFTVAGLQKLANPGFLRASTPGSFAQQVRGAILTSPLHHLLDPVLHAPTAAALVISCGELAVGLATLTGTLARVAAAGGMLLSLAFFLAVSFNDSPYYYGADIVFFFAWTPLLLGGAGPWSLDELLLAPPAGARARSPGRVSAAGQPIASRQRPGEIERRALLRAAAGAGAVAGLAAVAGALAASIGRLVGSGARTAATLGSGGAGPAGGKTAVGGASGTVASGTGSSASPTGTATSVATRSPRPTGTRVLAASAVPVGGAAYFLDPSQQLPAFAVQPVPGTYRAFSAVCTHAGCTVQFDRPTEQFVCPCHGSVFEAATGAVVQGPAAAPLPGVPIRLGPDGDLYAGA